jgi:hypothetical protein
MLEHIRNTRQYMAARQGVSRTQAGPNRNSKWSAVMADGTLYPVTKSAQGEVWRPVPSEPGMLASSLGRVVAPPSYAPMARGGYRAYWPQPTYGQEARAQSDAQHSYRLVMVPRKEDDARRQSPRKVHQLVCEAFHGPKPFPEAVVVHLNEDAHDNRPENLKWGTQRENMNAPGFIEYCRSRTGENSPGAKAKQRRPAD